MHPRVSIGSELCSPSDILNPSIYILHLCILWHIAQLPQTSLERHHKVFPIEYHLHIHGKGTLLSEHLYFLSILINKYKMMKTILTIITKIMDVLSEIDAQEFYRCRSKHAVEIHPNS